MRGLQGKARELGDGFTVARVLTQIGQRTVGPFVFFDYFGPVDFAPGKGIDVRPHPHIGLATITYLFDGSQIHRDTLGSVQEIVPGDVNWMTAGRGIAHSERTGPEVRARGHRMHGIQSWVGLPTANEEDSPSFQHIAKADLPVIEREGATLRVVTGKAYGLTSPVKVPMEIFYVDAQIKAGATVTLPDDYAERGAMVVGGTVVGRRRAWRRRNDDLRSGRARRDHREDRCPRDAAGRSAARRPTPRLVEFRRQLARTHRAGQGRMEILRLWEDPGRRRRIHPSSRPLR